MTGYGDAGDEIIGRLSARLGCPPHQLTLWQRGLTWHPGGLTQHIWAEPAANGSVPASWRVHLRTWCLRRVVTSSAEMMSAISDELPLNALSALVRKPGSPSRLGLGASVRMDADRVEWTSRFVAAVARLQAHDAIRLSCSPAILAAGAAADVASTRPETDVEEAVHTPSPLDPHLLPPLALDLMPFHEIAEALRAHDRVRAIATHSGVTASFPWTHQSERQDFIMLEMRLAARKGLGKGVWTSMSMPLAGTAQLQHALALNEAEMTPSSATDIVGGWIGRGTSLVHDAFVPWSLCSGEVIRYVADSVARRASWLRLEGHAILPAGWNDASSGRVIPFRRQHS